MTRGLRWLDIGRLKTPRVVRTGRGCPARIMGVAQWSVPYALT
jgi:hypothetical protein